MDNTAEAPLRWLQRTAAGLAFTGAADLAAFHRIPSAQAAGMPDKVRHLVTDTAGVCLRLRTDSPCIAIRATLREAADMPHMPRTGSSGFDVFRHDAGKPPYFVANFRPEPGALAVEGRHQFLAPGMKDLAVYFPLYNGVKDFALGIEEGARLEAPAPFSRPGRVVFYGSSITQGGCAGRPGNAYTNILSRMLGVETMNLGFSGAALGEEALARYIAGLPMAAFVMDYDANAPDLAHLQRTYRPFYETVRAAQPALPILFITRPHFDIDPQSSIQRRAAIRAVYDAARRQGDDRLWFIDGETLFGTDFRDACTVDMCHPNDLGFLRMAQTIEPVLKAMLDGEIAPQRTIDKD